MSVKNTISITEARKRIFDIAKAVQRPGVVYTLTENGRSKVTVLSAEEYDSLMETLEILSDPTASKRIEQAEKEIERGEYVSWDDFKKDWGYGMKTNAQKRTNKEKKKHWIRGKKNTS